MSCTKVEYCSKSARGVLPLNHRLNCMKRNAIVDQSKDVKQIQLERCAQYRWDKRLESEAVGNCLTDGQNNQ